MVTTKIAIDSEKDFIAKLEDIVASTRSQAYAAVNFTQTKANWLIGKQIVEQEQRGEMGRVREICHTVSFCRSG